MAKSSRTTKILTLVQQRVSMQHKERGKKYEWKKEKATALQERGGRGTIRKQKKLYKKPSQQRNKARRKPKYDQFKAPKLAFYKQKHNYSLKLKKFLEILAILLSLYKMPLTNPIQGLETASKTHGGQNAGWILANVMPSFGSGPQGQSL